jgi:hypothetical protein
MIGPLRPLTAVLLLSVVAAACARASGTTGGVPYVAGPGKPVSSGPIPGELVPRMGVLPTPTPCYVLDHVGVATTATTVTVTLYQGHDPGSKGMACIDIGIFASVSEVLAEPLAGRRIVDGTARGSA